MIYNITQLIWSIMLVLEASLMHGGVLLLISNKKTSLLVEEYLIYISSSILHGNVYTWEGRRSWNNKIFRIKSTMPLNLEIIVLCFNYFGIQFVCLFILCIQKTSNRLKRSINLKHNVSFGSLTYAWRGFVINLK